MAQESDLKSLLSSDRKTVEHDAAWHLAKAARQQRAPLVPVKLPKPCKRYAAQHLALRAPLRIMGRPLVSGLSSDASRDIFRKVYSKGLQKGRVFVPRGPSNQGH